MIRVSLGSPTTGGIDAGQVQRILLSGVKPARFARACRTCGLANLYLPLMFDLEVIDALDRIVQRRRPLAKGVTLYRAGEWFGAICAARAGSLEATSLAEEGAE